MPVFRIEYEIKGKIDISARDYETAVDILEDLAYSEVAENADDLEIIDHEEVGPDEDDRYDERFND